MTCISTQEHNAVVANAVTSAAAMARQRQEAQEVAFKGLSLEAVLKTAKKPKPPPCVVRNRHSAPDAEPAAS